MRILFVADGRSPTAQNWMRHFSQRGAELYLASTFACDVDFPVMRLEVTPVAFSSMRKKDSGSVRGSSRTLGLRTAIRHWLGPLTIRRAAQRLRGIIEEVHPDVVHAMRIPFEGMLAAEGYAGVPLIVSAWGNDFTLHAPSTPLMREYTRWTMKVADALHADCARDIRLAREWGLGEERPTFLAPGNGGVRTEVFFPPTEPAPDPVVINPRGMRTYVRNEAFFRAIPLVLAKRKNARFICLSMAGEPQALRWINELKIEHAVELTPRLDGHEVAAKLRSAQVLVSPSVHDGTPNSLLEGMACGCFPVAGDLESIREWITSGKNGLLVDPNDPQSIADAILLGLEREDLRHDAAGLNQRSVSLRADYAKTMKRAEEFYKTVIDGA